MFYLLVTFYLSKKRDGFRDLFRAIAKNLVRCDAACNDWNGMTTQ